MFYLYGVEAVSSEVFPDNHFESTLPSTIGQWQRLKVFFIAQEDENHTTGFTGTLPESISQWTDLEVRSLGADTPQTMHWQSFWFFLQIPFSTQFLAAYNNDLTGTLSEEVGQWSNLQMINIA